MSLDSFKSRKTLKVGSKSYVYYSLTAAEKNGLPGISKLPYSMKVLLENLLRNEDGRSVTKKDIESFVAWLDNRGKGQALSTARAVAVQRTRGQGRARHAGLSPAIPPAARA
mgnify:CR=1 FL=1